MTTAFVMKAVVSIVILGLGVLVLWANQVDDKKDGEKNKISLDIFTNSAGDSHPHCSDTHRRLLISSDMKSQGHLSSLSVLLFIHQHLQAQNKQE